MKEHDYLLFFVSAIIKLKLNIYLNFIQTKVVTLDYSYCILEYFLMNAIEKWHQLEVYEKNGNRSKYIWINRISLMISTESMTYKSFVDIKKRVCKKNCKSLGKLQTIQNWGKHLKASKSDQRGQSQVKRDANKNIAGSKGCFLKLVDVFASNHIFLFRNPKN